MESEKILQEQIRKAPKEIRDILAGGDWSQTINQTSLINNLSLEQKTALENEVLFVLLGMSLPAKLTENIQSSLLINEMLAEKISSEIKTKIISPVESFLPTEEESDEKLPEIPLEDLPAIVPGEEAHDTVKQVDSRPFDYAQGKQPTPSTPPVNLPTDSNVPNFETPTTNNQQPTAENGDREGSTQPKQTGYPKGMDPYREPIE